MDKICRDPAATSSRDYDLIIVGGGIYGVMLSFEASRRKLRSLLLERDDFGGATTFNSLRILHGGLRYLQRMDLRRFRESVAERCWFMRTFPGLVKPLPCIMPLYGDGLRCPLVLRVGLWANDVLSRNRNHGVPSAFHLPAGSIISAEQTREIFPSVDVKGLRGGAVWYDAFMPDSQRLVIETLRLGCEKGAAALNYVEAKELLKTKQCVAGVRAIDRESGNYHEYRASVVVNAAGPWCREIAKRFDRDEPKLFRSSLAWNVLLDRKCLSEYAVAVAPKKSKGRTYFLIPWKGMLLAGTGHSPWNNAIENPTPSITQMQEFLDDLNLAVPQLEVTVDDIVHIFPGLLPVAKSGTVNLATREVIIDHSENSGPSGLYSVSGVKFTTSRRVAEKTLKRIFVRRNEGTDDTLRASEETTENRNQIRGIFDLTFNRSTCDANWRGALHSLIQEESAQHLEDLVYRRTNLWENPELTLRLAPTICELFSWENMRCQRELARLKKELNKNTSFSQFKTKRTQSHLNGNSSLQ